MLPAQRQAIRKMGDTETFVSVDDGCLESHHHLVRQHQLAVK